MRRPVPHILALLGLIALVLVAVWGLRSTSVEPRQHLEQAEEIEQAEQVEQAEQLEEVEEVEEVEQVDLRRAPRPRTAPKGERASRPRLPSQQAWQAWRARRRAELDAGRFGQADADAGEVAERPWVDPTNQRVLGDRRWMAQPPPEVLARVEEVFDQPEPYDPRLTDADRRASIEAVRQITDACFDRLLIEHPDARGRIIVAWEALAAEAGGDTGRVLDPRIEANVDLRFPSFEACILTGATTLTFPATREGEAITVRYPFFYQDI